MSGKAGKILNKYRSLSPGLKASFWFVVCSAIQKAALILTTPIYSRLLTQAQFGEYKVFQSWVEVTAILTTLDIFYDGYNVGMEKFRNDRKAYTASMHGLCIAMTTIWVLLLFPFASHLAPLVRISPVQFRLLLIYMYVFPVYQFWSSRQKFEYQYKKLILVTSISTFFTVALGTVAAVVTENKSDWLIIVRVLVEGMVAIPLLFVSISGIKSLYNKSYWGKALKFNIPLVPHYLSAMILNHSDVIMIDMICGKADAGIYSLVYSIAMVITVVQNAVSSAIVPWLYKKLRNRDFTDMSKVLTGVITAMAVLNISLMLLAPEAVAFMGSSEYAEAIYVVPPITFGVFLTVIYGLFSHVEFFFHYNRFAATASLISAVSNIILNYVFLNLYGYMAAGYTTFVSYLLLMILHFCGLWRVTKKNDISYKNIVNIKHIVMIILGFALSVVIIFITYDYPVLRYGLILLIIAGMIIRRRQIARVIGFFMKKDENRQETASEENS